MDFNSPFRFMLRTTLFQLPFRQIVFHQIPDRVVLVDWNHSGLLLEPFQCFLCGLFKGKECGVVGFAGVVGGTDAMGEMTGGSFFVFVR